MHSRISQSSFDVKSSSKTSTSSLKQPITHTQSPIVTGTSILALKYDGGVMIISDTCASYGKMSRYHDVERVRKLGEDTLVAGSGDYSDYQQIMDSLEEQYVEEFCAADGAFYTPAELHAYVSRIIAYRRGKFDPFWNSVIVAGYDKDSKESFLGLVDMWGTKYEENILATAYGAYIALPILRKEWRKDLTKSEAEELLKRAMTVLLYRDCKAANRFVIANVTADGAEISDPFSLSTRWSYKRFKDPNFSGTSA